MTTTELITKDKRKFIDWHENLCEEYDCFTLESDSAWFDYVEESHTEIREQIDGIGFSFQRDLNDIQSPVPIEECSDIIKQIKNIIPGFLNAYHLEDTHLLVPFLPNGMRVSKKAIGYLSKSLGATSEQINKLHKLFSQLGKKWAEQKTTSKTLYGLLLTSAQAFAALGHYGPDHVSCFKHGGGSVRDKYKLGISNNSFVFLIKDEENDDLLQNNVGRFWGWFNNDDSVVNFCNYYSSIISHGNAIAMAKACASVLLNEDETDLSITKNMLEVSRNIAYHNNNEDQINISIHNNSVKVNRQLLILDQVYQNNIAEIIYY